MHNQGFIFSLLCSPCLLLGFGASLERLVAGSSVGSRGALWGCKDKMQGWQSCGCISGTNCLTSLCLPWLFPSPEGDCCCFPVAGERFCTSAELEAGGESRVGVCTLLPVVALLMLHLVTGERCFSLI